MVKHFFCLFFASLFFVSSLFADDPGEEIYKNYCASCHENELLRAPDINAIKSLGKAGIQDSLASGSMQEVGDKLREYELNTLIDFLSMDKKSISKSNNSNNCLGSPKINSEVLWSGWGNGLSNSRLQSKSNITTGNLKQLHLSWAFGFKDAVRVRSQPLVTEDAIFVGSQSGHVYALSLKNGCIWWSYEAESEVRGSIVLSHDKSSVLFSDFDSNIYRLNRRNGNLQWKENVADHPTTTITGSMATYQNLLFIPLSSTEVISAINSEYECCSFRGGMIALDIENGDQVWRMYTVPEPQKTGFNITGTSLYGPSGAPVWSTPTIDVRRGLLYIGVGQNYSHPSSELSDAVVAVKMSTGEIVWSQQTISNDIWNAGCVTNQINCPGEHGPDFDIGASIILSKLDEGRDILLVGQKSGMVYGLDPDRRGHILWQKRVGRGGKKGGIHWGMTADSKNVYVPIGDLPEQIDIQGEPRPGLHSLSIENGDHQWYKPAFPVCKQEAFKCYASYSAAASSVEGMILVGSMNGMIEVISSDNGDILWSYNTARSFDTVNKVVANGGSIDSDGPIIAGNHLIVTSGYDLYGQITGNVILVFNTKE